MTKQFIDLYKEVSGQIAAKSASVFNAERDEAARMLESVDFPTRKTLQIPYTFSCDFLPPCPGQNTTVTLVTGCGPKII